MGNVRHLIALSDEEVRDYIETSQTVIIGTLNHDGWPHLVPMWYALVDGLIQMHTYKTSQKVRNVERDPRGSVLIEDGDAYNELRGVFIRGRFEVIEDPEATYRIGLATAKKYQGVDEDAAGEYVRKAVRKRVGLAFHPEKVSSWDHRRLP